MEVHRLILEELRDVKFSDEVDDESNENIQEFVQLYEHGYITAKNASGDTGLSFLYPNITLAGLN